MLIQKYRKDTVNDTAYLVRDDLGSASCTRPQRLEVSTPNVQPLPISSLWKGEW